MAGVTGDIPPCPTVYINNLNEKVKKEELKKTLYAIFSQFGPILEIVVLRTVKMRGQAFIVFKDTSAATAAIQNMHGFPFYDKPMRLAFAKSKSYATQKEEGTYVAKTWTEKRKDAPSGDSNAPAKKKAAKPASGDVTMKERVVAPKEAPNKILFVQNLPPDTTALMLEMLFQQYNGFQEVRLVPGKSDIAFVEFDNDNHSGTALQGLQGFKIVPTHPITISFAKQ